MVGSFKTAARALCLAILAVLLPAGAAAGRLPIRSYTTADGLPHSRVHKIFRDSHGFLWFCTPNGLSRFDGESFTNYGPRHGLTHPAIYDVTQDRDGAYWIGSYGGGVYRFDPDARDPERLFTSFSVGEDTGANLVVALHADGKGRLWVGTRRGLYVRDAGEQNRFRRIVLTSAGLESPPRVRAVLEDRSDNLWIGTSAGLIRRTPEGRIARLPLGTTGTIPFVYALYEDPDGRLWAGHTAGITIYGPPAPATPGTESSAEYTFAGEGGHFDGEVELPTLPGEARWFPIRPGTADRAVRAFHLASDGVLWIASNPVNLIAFDGRQVRRYAEDEGLADTLIVTLVEDREQNLWMGSEGTGAMRLARGGFTAYDRPEGLGCSHFGHLIQDGRGAVSVVCGSFIQRFDGQRFHAVKPNLPGVDRFRDEEMLVLPDRSGAWWLGTDRGLYLFRGALPVERLSGETPVFLSEREVDLPRGPVTALFEDSGGDVWIGMLASSPLVRWERATDSFRLFGEADGLSPRDPPLSFAEDRAGNIWAIHRSGTLIHHREGALAVVATLETRLSRLLVDRAGRLWIAGFSGALMRLDDPQADKPSAPVRIPLPTVGYGYTQCLAEDHFGRLYVGCSNGVHRIDPAGGQVHVYGVEAGLSNVETGRALAAGDGSVWFTTRQGVSRFVPRPRRPDPPIPPIRISGLRLAGVRHPVSALGQTDVSGLRLGPTERQVEIDFASLSFEVGGEIRYQYRIAGDDDWSSPTTNRSVNLASLAPGSYRFEVRAVSADGVPSESPATVSFRILPPLWRRWWAVILQILGLLALAYAIHRVRVARAVALERVRTRVATDLHDDLGASLSQIAILSEVVSRRADGADPSARSYLSRIAESSRDLVDSMEDIVWAISPKTDRLSDLVYRMRRFAGDTLEAKEIDLTFHAPTTGDDARLDPDVRREIYLIFKESINNAVRHAGCSSVEVELAVEGKTLRLTVRDDGTGFDAGRAHDGHGLGSMRQRARGLGGEVAIESGAGRGTTVRLTVGLRGRRGVGFGRRHMNG